MKDGCGNGLRNRLILNQLDSEFGNVKQLVSEISCLRTAGKPTGVAQYTLSKKLPKELLGKLPSAEDFKQILVNDGGNEL